MIITGGNAGIGKETAVDLARYGMHVRSVTVCVQCTCICNSFGDAVLIEHVQRGSGTTIYRSGGPQLQ